MNLLIRKDLSNEMYLPHEFQNSLPSDIPQQQLSVLREVVTFLGPYRKSGVKKKPDRFFRNSVYKIFRSYFVSKKI